MEMQTQKEWGFTKLPKKKIFATPRILLADAYTIGADKFQSDKAKEKSTYYITFRRRLHEINPHLYDKGDDRIIFVGLGRILEKLFYTPVTHAEIDEAIRFLAHAKATTTGYANYDFPEHLWRRIVDEFNGRPPIKIKALREGSVVYPNEPVIEIKSLVDGFGELAHRNVQAFAKEGLCYSTMYDRADNNEILSQVADCYDFFHAVKNYHLPLALRSKAENNGKVVVARPDSGDALKQILYVIELAIENGLYTEKTINGKTWKYGTFLKFIEGDGMSFKVMKEIIKALMEKGYAPFGWGLFGVGGGLRNDLKRDNLSAKYALSAMGNDDKGVAKFSETLGKTTLPGPFKVLRDLESLANKRTIVFATEEGEDAMVEFFNGLRMYEPFGEGQDDDFLITKARIVEQMKTMPLTLESATNHNYPASEAILKRRLEILQEFAPSKEVANY